MRWSQMHIPTLRQDPAEADAASHRLLLRAGYIRPVMAGHYSLLPFAVRVRAKIIEIIRQEMNRIGAQEFLQPAMHPAELWRRSGRLEIMGDEMFRMRDRKGTDVVLGMTHEEVFSTLARELHSYRKLPQMWYQIQTKFRDEPRPRAGLMRTREFTMKDSYSFDLTPEGLDLSFRRHYDAYKRIFERLGIPAIPVEASSGTMGGSESTEFMSPADVGEDLVVHCPECGYAANVEKATSRLAEAEDGPGLPTPVTFETPDTRTIEDLATRFNAPADRQIKTLIYIIEDTLTLVLLRGDHSLNEQKLIDTVGTTVLRPADAEEIKTALGAQPGSLGAVAVTELPVIADHALHGRRDMFTGANSDNFHLRGVDVDRDITVNVWADLREVAAGQACVQCGKALKVQSTIEVGHIFKLGYKYADALGVTVLGMEGNETRLIMGCYGIGVERAMAAIVESHHDDKGIVWPASVAPFHVAVVVAQSDDADTVKTGEEIYEMLNTAGVEVILDDRPERAGVKFRDFELTGIPYRITVGKRGLAGGVIEWTPRSTLETVKIPRADILNHVQSELSGII